MDPQHFGGLLDSCQRRFQLLGHFFPMGLELTDLSVAFDESIFLVRHVRQVALHKL